MKLVRERKLLENPASFSNKIEWTYWELWHHEGRRARHGAAMMGPDYTWWHGFYEVAQHFYFKLLPEARELGDPEVDAFVDETPLQRSDARVGARTDRRSEETDPIRRHAEDLLEVLRTPRS